jgi:hypothetical protein
LKSSNPIYQGAKKMEKPVEICTFELDVSLVDKEKKRLSNPMITVAFDSDRQVIVGVYISTGKPLSSNSITELLNPWHAK